ncbi:MAG: sporulation transcription factor Spo0A [Bacilli bacterium]|nr:sporulation transcription factor Spo0A [Bacilli bacterium]
MENQTRVLVVDNNQNITTKIEKQFSSHAVIKVVKTIENGGVALDYILKNKEKFDIIVMDLILPDLDGLSLLQKMKENNIKKKIIVTTSYKKEYTVSMTNHYDISYYMLKPFSMLALETRILEITNSNLIKSAKLTENEREVQVAISKLLHKLGIPSHIKGYTYIRESVFLFYKNSDVYGGITKEIYPEVAIRFSTTASRVERAIRHAIEVSWTRGDYDLMEEIFGNSVAFDRAKPTNSEFIATIADRLRFDKKLIHA